MLADSSWQSNEREKTIRNQPVTKPNTPLEIVLTTEKIRGDKFNPILSKKI